MKHVAVVLAALAVVMMIVALTRSQPAPEPLCRTEYPAPVVDAGADAAPPIAVAPPTIDGVQARAAVRDHGVDIQLDVALSVAAPSRTFVDVKASCQLDGEWYTGTAYVFLEKLPPGTSVVQQRIAIGTQQVFTAPPTACQIGLAYQRAWLAKKCWDGATITDGTCAVASSTTVAVSAVHVATSLDRYGSRRVGSPVDLEISLDAQLARSLDDWSIEIAADCTLPDGSTQHATERVPTYGVHAGRPFTGRAWLFHGAARMADVPRSCTVAIELADRQQLVHAPVSAWCWHDGSVAPGAC